MNTTKRNAPGRCANTAEGSEPNQSQSPDQKRSSAMSLQPDNPHTVDSTGIAQGAGIPDADLDKLIAETRSDSTEGLTDVGPAPTPPAWAEPGAQPEWFTPTGGGAPVCVWERQLASEGPWISCEDTVRDGRVLRSEARIFGAEEPSDGLTADQARQLAAQLIAIADILDEAAS